MNYYLCESNRLFREGLNREGEDAPVCLSLAVVSSESGGGFLCLGGMEKAPVTRNHEHIEEVGVYCTSLGVHPTSEYEQVQVSLEPGDFILMTTDSITESRQEAVCMGLEGLKQLVSDARHVGTLNQMGRSILDGAREFGGGMLRDDAVLLLIRRR